MFSETLGHLTEKTFSPCVGILTHPGCVVCWAINMYLKKKQNDIPLMQSILFYYTILEAYPTKSQKVDSSKNPAQFLVAIFGFFRKKKLQKPCVQKETSQQTPPTDFTTRSRSSVSRIRRVPISGVGHRMFGGR